MFRFVFKVLGLTLGLLFLSAIFKFSNFPIASEEKGIKVLSTIKISVTLGAPNYAESNLLEGERI